MDAAHAVETAHTDDATQTANATHDVDVTQDAGPRHRRTLESFFEIVWIFIGRFPTPSSLISAM